MDFNTNSGQQSGTASTSPTPAPALSAATPASLLGFNALVPRDPIAASATLNPQTPSTPVPQVSPAPTTKHWYGANAVDDAYWSKQPAPVQQLREMQDQGQRQTLAMQLAGQGYSIDNAIMVWGWDAGQVTAIRQDSGYTWVPAAQQQPISAVPGVSGPGLTTYDPLNPPAGSIKVG